MTPVRSALWFVAVSLLCVAGCPSGASNNKGKIEGTKWDAEDGSRALEFTKDGKLFYDLEGGVGYEGTYTLGAGDNVTFTFTKELAGSKTHVEKISISGDHLTMSDTTGSVKFKKVVDEKVETDIKNTTWENDPGKGEGKYGNIAGGEFRFTFEADGKLLSRGEKVGTYKQTGDTLSIHFDGNFLDSKWQSEKIHIEDHQNFTLTDAEGNKIRFRKTK
jgi:hypothetical protein